MLGVDKILNPQSDGAETAMPGAPTQYVPVSFALRWANYLFMIPMVAVATVFFGTLSLIVGIWDSSGQQQHWIARQWARVLLLLAFTRVRLENAERLKALGPVVFACNHLSYYDTPALFAKLPFQFRILAKAPLFKVPFIGWYLTRSGQVSIDQSSARAGIASLMRGVKTIQHGLPLVIFPEGGRAADGELKAMMAGAAFIAIKAQVPLVPLTLVGTYELLPIHMYAIRPRPVKLIVGEPIATVGMTTRDAETLTERMKSVIHATYVAEQG